MTDPPIRPSAHPAVLLGIDCGGSHTAVAVGDQRGRVLARADGPGSAMRPGGAERSAAVVLDVARRAATQAKVTLPASLALVGAAGAGRPPEQEALAAAIAATGVAARVAVRGDTEIALAAAARAHDGLEESSTLLGRLLVALGLETFDDLIRWTATATPAQVAALAPHVLNAAREGETVAQQIVEEAAAELSQLVRVLLPHFSGADPIKMVTAGGLLRPGSPLLIALRANLATDLPRARISEGGAQVDSPAGALRLAAQLLAH